MLYMFVPNSLYNILINSSLKIQHINFQWQWPEWLIISMFLAPAAYTKLHAPHHKRDLLVSEPVSATRPNSVDFRLDHNLKLLLMENNGG